MMLCEHGAQRRRVVEFQTIRVDLESRKSQQPAFPDSARSSVYQ